MPPQDNTDPYGFITNPENKPRKTINFGKTPQQRLIIVGVGFALLIIVFVFLISIFSQASNAQKDRLINLAQTQTEIIRISEIGNKQSTNLDTKALASNTSLTLKSDLQDTTSLLAKRGTKLKDKSLALKKDASTDAKLEEAKINNQFDEVFTDILQKQLTDYSSLIKQAYTNGNSAEKQALQQDYNEINLLL